MKFRTLPIQVAEHITAEIAKGRWVGWLPGERILAEILRVSRRTLSAAIILLNNENVIRSEKGRGNRIIKQTKPDVSNARKSHKVGLLVPEPLDILRPGTGLWVGDLRTKLAEAGCLLTTFQGTKYFSRHPDKALKRLLASNPQSCWVVARSLFETQQWFAQQGIPCVLAGTAHASIDLPDIDVDFRAMCFHAANTALGKGHRRIVLLLTEASGYLASEQNAEAGFREAFEKKPGAGEPIVVYHKRGPNHLLRVLERLFAMPAHPTAIITSHGMDYLTIFSFLAQRNLRIPAHVSLMSRNDDAFLDALLPVPTRYCSDPHRFAGKLYKMIMHIIDRSPLPQRHIRIEPRFIKGASLTNLSSV